MLRKNITYTGSDGIERKEDFYFHLNKAEITEMEVSSDGGIKNMLEKIVADKDAKKIMEFVKTLILKSYGVKTSDGRGFSKSPEMTKAFEQSEAYSELFMEIVLDADKMAAFVNGIVPKVDSSPAVITAKN